MFAKSMHRWNAVNVVGTDQVIRRGLVVDKEELGLVVDFGIRGKSPEVIPFRSVYRSNEPTSDDSDQPTDIGGTVWVLLKLSPKHPWTWYQSKHLAGINKGFILAEITIGPDVVVDTVLCSRTCTNPIAGNSVRSNVFLKERVPVPHGCAFSPALENSWNKRFRRTYPIGIADEYFQFLILRSDKEPDDIAIEAILREGIPTGIQAPVETVQPRGIKRPHDGISDDETPSVVEECSLKDIPVDVLGIVFSFMSAKQQTRVGRVCRAWNSALLSAECARLLKINLNYYEGTHYDNYLLASSFYHCMKPSTHYLVLVGKKCYELRGAMRLLKELYAFVSSTLITIIFGRMEMRENDSVFDTQLKLFSEVPALCKRVIFKNIILRFIFGADRESLWDAQMPYRDLRVAFGAFSAVSPAEAMDVLERAAESFADPKHQNALDRVSKWIRYCDTGNPYAAQDIQRSHQNDIVSVLKVWQRGDARFGPTASWKDVQAARLDANLLTLRNCTITALVCLERSMFDYPVDELVDANTSSDDSTDETESSYGNDDESSSEE
ncbi:uncharacterized protein LOC129585971 [Paramacrobiotus metropolitanus]|uniref:uncharacterized protein LOC129585971 n=1 Tax=Paramacrobiotus metropolitanus TaxID=2943436 RepID=UPI0024464346|nr:uncharacterized protein LOC129585971 [Paramacrobiotus metropolitanus]XP_055334905.1 uncharacterized protein LOC129585971 [Paramacrobiotus metropolitanus]